MSTRPVPTNLDSWPGIHDLVSTYKHMLHVLWSSPSQLVSVIGVGRPGTIEHLSKATRLDEPVVLEALRELERRGLLVLDEDTREIAVRRWCAFHKFSGRWAAVAELAFNQVSSPKIKGVLVKQEGIKELFPLKSDIELANSNSNNNSNSNSNSNSNIKAAARTPVQDAKPVAAINCTDEKRRHPLRTKHGIDCWYPSEDAPAGEIERLVQPELIENAVVAIKARRNSAGKPQSPVHVLVAAELERQRQLSAVHAAEQERIAQQVQERKIAEQQSALRAARTVQAEAYFDSLSDADRALLINQFATHLVAINDGVYQLYRKNNLQSKSVQFELFKFIDTTVLFTSTEESILLD